MYRARRTGRDRLGLGRGSACPLRIAALPRRCQPPAECDRPAGPAPPPWLPAAARSARVVRTHERRGVTRLHRAARVETRGGRVRASAAVLAVHSTAAGFAGYRLSLAVASRHLVPTATGPARVAAL